MVKGVNKTVIEINDTGSRFFEKVVFYVSSKYSSMSAAQLEKAANAFAAGLNSNCSCKMPLRKRVRLKKWVKISLCCIGLLAVTGTAIFLIF